MSRVGTVIKSPFDPRQIPGLQLYLRSDLGVTLNSGNVSAWADQSGRGNHVAQGTAALQPNYDTGAINGLPALRSAADRYLANASVPALAATAGLHIFVVAKITDAASNYSFVGMRNNSSPFGPWWLRAGGAATQITCTTAGNSLNGAAMPLVSGTMYLIEGWYDGANIRTAVNGVEGVPTALTGALIATANGLGVLASDGTGFRPLNGSQAFTAVFDRALAAGQQAKMRSFINGLYRLY